MKVSKSILCQKDLIIFSVSFHYYDLYFKSLVITILNRSYYFYTNKCYKSVYGE